MPSSGREDKTDKTNSAEPPRTSRKKNTTKLVSACLPIFMETFVCLQTRTLEVRLGGVECETYSMVTRGGGQAQAQGGRMLNASVWPAQTKLLPAKLKTNTGETRVTKTRALEDEDASLADNREERRPGTLNVPEPGAACATPEESQMLSGTAKRFSCSQEIPVPVWHLSTRIRVENVPKVLAELSPI